MALYGGKYGATCDSSNNPRRYNYYCKFFLRS
nr:MAG TPA: hypothetical protein [Caudoviricetes sp.]